MILGKKDKKKVDFLKELMAFYGTLIGIATNVQMGEVLKVADKPDESFREAVLILMEEFGKILKEYEDLDLKKEDLLETKLAKNLEKKNLKVDLVQPKDREDKFDPMYS